MRSLAAMLLRPVEDDDEMHGLILGEGPEREFLWLDQPGASERTDGAPAAWCRRAALDGEGNVQELTVSEAITVAGPFLGSRVLDITDRVLDAHPALPGRERLIGEIPAARMRLLALLDDCAQAYAEGAAQILRHRAGLAGAGE